MGTPGCWHTDDGMGMGPASENLAGWGAADKHSPAGCTDLGTLCPWWSEDTPRAWSGNSLFHCSAITETLLRNKSTVEMVKENEEYIPETEIFWLWRKVFLRNFHTRHLVTLHRQCGLTEGCPVETFQATKFQTFRIFHLAGHQTDSSSLTPEKWVF